MDHQDISKIANQLGSEWFIFGAHLGYSDAQLENLKEIYQSRPNDRNYMMLYRWQEQVEKEGEDAKILLAAHLEESGCKHLADELLQDVSSADAIHMYLKVSEKKRKKVEIGIRKVNFDLKDNQQSVFVGQQIKRIINCPKCKKLFHKPRNLPCGHTFCHPCIVNLLHINEKTCPTCKECVTLRKEQDVEKLSINTLISDLINMNKKYEFWQINNASNNPCDMCSKPESLNFCIDCLKYMCSTCSASHSKWPALKTHFILEVNTENEPIIELRKKKPQCNKHGNEVVSFCVNCDHGVCEECKSSCPKDHLFEDLHSHCKDLRKVISQHIRKSSIKIEHYSKCVERYEKKEQEMIQEREIALEEVGSLMNAIHRLLDQKAESMRSSIHEKHNRMNQRLHSEKQIILEEKIKLLSRIEYLQFLYEYGSDAHIVTEYEESQASLVDTGVQPNIDILDTFVIEFKKNPSLEEIILNLPLGELDNYYVMNEEENWEEKSDNKRVEYTENSFPSKYPFPSRPFDEEALCRDEPVPTLRSSLCHQKQSRKWSLSPKHSQSVPTRANPMLCFVDSSHKVETVMQRNKHETLTPEQDLSIGNGDKEQNRQSFIGSTTFENAVSDIGDDDCECESICTEDEDDIHTSETMYPSSDQRTNIQNNENERGKFPQPPQVQRKDFHAIDEVVQNIPRLPLPRRVRIMHEFNIVVSGMAVSEKDIALISLISRCISIFHYEKQTFSSISHLCKKIEAPYDGVYTEDENNETGLFFTETDRDKRGVKILYKSKSKLKLVNFTSRVEDPRGISANDQNVFVCDRNRCSILVFRKDGDLILSISNMYSRFQMPTYVFADGHDRLVISDPSTYSVRVLSGIEDRCTVIDTYTSSNFMLHGQIVPGKCCIDHGRVLIPDKSHREVWNCSNKQKLNFIFDCKLGDGPVAVSRLSSTKIVVATKSGKILVL